MAIKRKRAIGPRDRRRQKGQGLTGNLFKTGINLGSNFFKFTIGQKIVEEGIKNAPNIYSAGVNRLSNNKLKRALESTWRIKL